MRLRRDVLPYAALLGALPARVLAGDVISTDGFQTCLNNASVSVQEMQISFDRSSNIVTFNVAGTSTMLQNVSATIQVGAYGKTVYNKTFDPCQPDTFVQQLCPVPKGHFAAQGTQKIPQQYASLIPGIAYTIPDLDGMGKLELKSQTGSQELACIQSTVTNQKSAEVPGVKWAAVTIGGAALAVSGLGAIAAFGGGGAGGSGAGASSPSPTFTETAHWLQSMALNGMLSVQYPAVYRSFAQNFGFSTGLIPWTSMQKTIDNFRAHTGGNLTHDNVEWLQQSTLVHQVNDSPSGLSKRDIVARGLDTAMLLMRDITASVNGSQTTTGPDAAPANDTQTAPPKQMNYVQGIQGYVEELKIPQSNTFMTVLLIFAIILAAITAGILLFKVILEAWALTGKFPKKLTSFRKNYWWLLAKTITNLILVLYGVWVLYCVYQFTQGDSWAAKLLAAVTLALFTAVLLGFTWKIYNMAHKFKKAEGDTSQLYEDKETWRRYSLFYDNYKRSYWWLFVPTIIYMFAKGCVIAGADGHGLAQTAGQLIVESLLLILILFLRPYEMKSGNWINIIIQTVRVVSVICILIFVEELGFSQTTKTVTGVVLIVTQSVLTGALAVLICINAIVNCVRMNPHRRKRKEQEKLHRDFDALTPLDARNSLLMYPMDKKTSTDEKSEMVSIHTRGQSKNGYDMVPLRDDSRDRLVTNGASLGGRETPRSRSISPDSMHREPQLPDLNYMAGPGRAL